MSGTIFMFANKVDAPHDPSVPTDFVGSILSHRVSHRITNQPFKHSREKVAIWNRI